MDVLEGVTVENNDCVILKSGKKITLRQKNGAHHMIENRLLSLCIPRGDNGDVGLNIGDMVAVTDIRAVVAIEAIDGVTKKVPSGLGEVIELMSEFTYNNDVDEWSEFKRLISPEKEKVEGMAKNLLKKAGSETESALL